MPAPVQDLSLEARHKQFIERRLKSLGISPSTPVTSNIPTDLVGPKMSPTRTNPPSAGKKTPPSTTLAASHFCETKASITVSSSSSSSSSSSKMGSGLPPLTPPTKNSTPIGIAPSRESIMGLLQKTEPSVSSSSSSPLKYKGSSSSSSPSSSYSYSSSLLTPHNKKNNNVVVSPPNIAPGNGKTTTIVRSPSLPGSLNSSTNTRKEDDRIKKNGNKVAIEENDNDDDLGTATIRIEEEAIMKNRSTVTHQPVVASSSSPNRSVSFRLPHEAIDTSLHSPLTVTTTSSSSSSPFHIPTVHERPNAVELAIAPGYACGLSTAARLALVHGRRIPTIDESNESSNTTNTNSKPEGMSLQLGENHPLPRYSQRRHQHNTYSSSDSTLETNDNSTPSVTTDPSNNHPLTGTPRSPTERTKYGINEPVRQNKVPLTYTNDGETTVNSNITPTKSRLDTILQKADNLLDSADHFKQNLGLSSTNGTSIMEKSSPTIDHAFETIQRATQFAKQEAYARELEEQMREQKLRKENERKARLAPSPSWNTVHPSVITESRKPSIPHDRIIPVSPMASPALNLDTYTFSSSENYSSVPSPVPSNSIAAITGIGRDTLRNSPLRGGGGEPIRRTNNNSSVASTPSYYPSSSTTDDGTVTDLRTLLPVSSRKQQASSAVQSSSSFSPSTRSTPMTNIQQSSSTVVVTPPPPVSPRSTASVHSYSPKWLKEALQTNALSTPVTENITGSFPSSPRGVYRQHDPSSSSSSVVLAQPPTKTVDDEALQAQINRINHKLATVMNIFEQMEQNNNNN